MKTILYINPLSTEITFLIFQNDTTIIKKTLLKNLETATSFPVLLVDTVNQYEVNEIWCITGPGPFTLMRIVTLSINALRYSRDIEIKSCHFFDLITENFIPIIEANPKEYLIKKNDAVVLIPKDSLEKGNYQGIISGIFSTEDIKYIQYKEDKNNIISVFSSIPCEIRMSPIYFKTPHITCPKH
ncbi:hypothetical protein HOO68_00935 [Candidatus Gracilibacteria bacterium]|nr:hypothetical protein [Candidatus Gracilibacteria bacterium]